jgi:hypothetical protein
LDAHPNHPTEADERRIGEIVDRAYELISFAAGAQPAWDEFRNLFTEPCVLALRVFPDDPAVSVMDMDAYVRTQMREGLSDEGYTELPGDRNIAITGEAASVHQAFAMQFATGPPVPAVDMFSLVKLDGRWRIVSIVSDMQEARQG